MGKKYDVVCITGTYKKDGQDKPIFKNVGSIIEKDGKYYLKMDHLVTVHNDGHVLAWFNLYQPKDRQQPQQAAQQNPYPYDDEIPF